MLDLCKWERHLRLRGVAQEVTRRYAPCDQLQKIKPNNLSPLIEYTLYNTCRRTAWIQHLRNLSIVFPLTTWEHSHQLSETVPLDSTAYWMNTDILLLFCCLPLSHLDPSDLGDCDTNYYRFGQLSSPWPFVWPVRNVEVSMQCRIYL